MSEKLKALFIQSVLISTGIVGVTSVEAMIYHFSGDSFRLQWYHPISFLLTGVICTLPSLILWGFEEWPRAKFIKRLIAHAIVLYIIVVLMGYLFVWYRVLSGFIYVSIGYFVVYIFVWAANTWISKRDEKEINEALDNIRDEE